MSYVTIEFIGFDLGYAVEFNGAQRWDTDFKHRRDEARDLALQYLWSELCLSGYVPD